MTLRRIRAGDVLDLSRESIGIDPGETYRQIGIYSWGKGIIHRSSVPGSELSKLRYFSFPSRALLLSNIQAWEGAVAVTGPEEAGYVASNRFLPYMPVDHAVHVEYLRHYFLSEPGLAQIRRASPGTQVRNRTLGIKLFEDIVIPLPALDEQRRIATHLDALSHVSLNLDDALKDRVGSLLDSIFDQFTWDTELSELLELDVDEFEVDPSTIYSQCGVYGKGRGMFLRGDLPGTETKYGRLRRVAAGQVVLSRLKAFEGAVAIVPDELAGSVLSQEFPTFSLRAGVDPGFVTGLIGRRRFTEAMQSGSTGVGARRERLSVGGFLKIRVPRPPTERQVKAGGLVRNKQTLDAGLSRRALLKEALLPAARNEIFNSMV